MNMNTDVKSRGKTATCRALCLLAQASLFALSCIDGYNPFSDISNAGASVYKRSFESGDTVSIFTTETLTVLVAVKEHTERIMVSARNNRRWNAPDTIIDRAQFSDEPFTFLVSFSDTGWQHVVFSSYLSDHSIAAETLSLYAVSPLCQEPVSGHFGDSIRLETPPVMDRDVQYYWSFGAGTVFNSRRCSTTAVVVAATPADSGMLWVAGDGHSSPAVPFAFSLDDTIPPHIECINNGYRGGDTVFTGDTVFNFGVRITDRETGPADSVSINGGLFTMAIGNEYYRVFTDMHLYTADKPLDVTVYALDHYGFGNDTTRIFRLVFQDTLPASSPLSLAVTVPSGATSVSGSRTFPLSGTLRASDSLSIVFCVNVNERAGSETLVLGAGSQSWTRTVTLDADTNHVAVLALDSTGADTLARVTRTILYRPELPDTIPPLIVEILANGAPAGGYFTAGTWVHLRMNIIDEATAVKLVTVNGDTAAKEPLPHWYSDTVYLQHLPAGNEIKVIAFDSSGNQAERTVLVFHNRRPVFTGIPVSRYVLTESLYESRVSAIDPDGDGISFSKQSGPAGFDVSADGAISWVPLSADTGTHRITLRAWDGFQPSYASYVLHAADSAHYPRPVTFGFGEEYFPKFLVAGRDTLSMTLTTLPGTGVSPFYFSARLVYRDSLLLADTTDNMLRWAPGIGDIGYQQIIVIVRDDFSSADTLYPRILVVKPNSPCMLEASFRTPAGEDGILDFSASKRPDTIMFHIIDPDDPIFERHRVTIYQARSGTMFVVDSAVSDSFTVVVDPAAFDGYDTLIAVASDRAGAVDSLVLILFYGGKPAPPALLSPAGGATGVFSDTVVFEWQAPDPDDDVTQYEFYLDTAASLPTAHSMPAETTVTVLTLDELRTYYWKVRAWNWKGFSESAVFVFTTGP